MNDCAATVADLLAAYRTEDPVEAGHLERMRALMGETGDPFDRDSADPGHFTASAFVTDGERLLLILHRKLGRWLQPGGHFEAGDTGPAEAAAREAGEETGLTGLVPVGDGLFDVDVHRVDHDGVVHEHFDLRFLFLTTGRPVAGDGVEAVAWAGLDDLGEFGADESLLRPARRVAGRMAGHGGRSPSMPA